SREATPDTTTFDSLPDGKSTIVGLFTDDAGKWASLRLIEQAGLKAGADYIAAESECRSGAVTALSLGTIPESTAAVTLYTGEATAISLNKNEATIGNNVTVTAFVDFAAEYISAVKKPELNVTLPAGVAFVANSVLVDSKAQSYSFDAATSTLSVPLSTTGSKVRFCISATEASAHCIAASVKFELENSNLIQPIGSITLTGRNLNLNVPSVVNDERLTAAGNCTAGSSIGIFDGDVLIGNTVADNSGAWSCNVALHEPFNSTVHRLSAKINTPDGRLLDTESQNVTVDLYRIVPLKVTMINTDHSGTAPSEQRTVFNLETSTFEGNSYYRYWPAYPTFSFIIELSNNSPDAVEDLGLLVYTTKQTWRALQGVYNPELGLWTASGDFQASELPAGVKVNILDSTPDVADRRMHSSADEAVAVIMNDYNASRTSNDIPDDAELSNPDMESYYASLSDAELEALISEESIDDAIQQIEDLLKDTDVLFTPSLTEAPDLAALCGLKYLSYKERSDDELLAEGYTRVDFTDGKPLYTRTQTDVVDVIDTAEKIHWQYTISAEMPSSAAHAPAARVSADELHQRVKDATEKIHSAIQDIKGYYEKLSEKFGDLEKVIEQEISKVEREYIAGRELRGRKRNALAALEDRLKTTTDPDAIADLERQITQHKNSIARLDRQVDSMKKSIKNGKTAIKDLRLFSGWLKKALPLTDIISKCLDAIRTFDMLTNVIASLPESCTCDED
ncbi:MAG: hypothetical protein K2L75_01270, partial [Muribaculaceae bacterium]|nr:hypothetical protein [Muribaculaceae bacterium]